MKQTVLGLMPELEGKYYIHSTACVIGNVKSKKGFSVWPNAVIRADLSVIDIGEFVNVQDSAVLHVDEKCSLRLGSFITIGHGAMLHSCEVGDNTLIGMGAIILDGAVIGKNCIVGAGTLVPPNKRVPDNSLIIGSPFSVLRQVTEEEAKTNIAHAKEYWQLALEYIKSADIY